MTGKALFALLVLMVSSANGLLDRSEQSRALPIQMDMRADGDITICTGMKKYINCRDGASIAITSAFWGRVSDKVCPSDDGDPVTDCEGSPDTLAIVRRDCEGRKECKLEAKHNELQNNGSSHCPGVNKYLIVNYTCVPDSKGVNLCDSAQTTLSCPAGWLLELADVFWGRRSSHTYCGATADSIECDASDFAGKFLRSKCNGKHHCQVKADPAVLEDGKHTQSCTGFSKYLLVNYVCNPKAKKADDAVEEEDTKLLQDTSSKELMGLLEKHLNEIKAPTESKPEVKEATTPAKTVTAEEKKPENKFTARNKGVSAPAPAVAPKTKTRSTLEKKTNSPFVATEDDDELTNSILNGPAFTRSIHKAETPAVAVVTPKDTKAVRKDEVADKSATAKEDKSATINTNMVKDNVPKAADEDFEVSEPSTVRSILARAKEVLKTLDTDSASIEKRTGISRTASTAASQVASLAQSLANKTKKRNRIMQQAVEAASSSKSKPGVARSLKSAGAPVAAGFGNTP